jgi:hypothetical protein
MRPSQANIRQRGFRIFGVNPICVPLMRPDHFTARLRSVILIRKPTLRLRLDDQRPDLGDGASTQLSEVRVLD